MFSQKGGRVDSRVINPSHEFGLLEIKEHTSLDHKVHAVQTSTINFYFTSHT